MRKAIFTDVQIQAQKIQNNFPRSYCSWPHHSEGSLTKLERPCKVLNIDSTDTRFLYEVPLIVIQ